MGRGRDKTDPPAPLVDQTASMAVPFPAEADEWESELAAWDRSLPIAHPAQETEPIPPGDLTLPVELPPEPSTSETARAAGVPEPISPDDFDNAITPASGSYAFLVASEEQDQDDDEALRAFQGGIEAVEEPAEDREEEEPGMLFAIPSGSFDDDLSPASGSYVALTTAEDAPSGLFDTEPGLEEAAPFPTDALPEMEEAWWQNPPAGTLSVGAAAMVPPSRDTWAHLKDVLADEWSREAVRDHKVDLALGAARLAELLGDLKQARAQLDAAQAHDLPDSSVGATRPGWTAVHRARLCLAERAGTIETDADATESLFRLALLPHPDQAAYRGLRAEWALDRSARGDTDAPVAAFVSAAPEGLARALADAELAWHDPSAAAAILAAAGHARSGALGAALLALAAGRSEVAGDYQAAAEQRWDGASLDPRRSLLRMGLLRDVTRMEGDAALPPLKDLLAVFGPSPFKVALARWGGKVAARAGRFDEAWRFLSSDPAPGPETNALLRDRLDVRGRPSARPPDTAEMQALLEAVEARWPHPATRTLALLHAGPWATDGAGHAFVLSRAEALTERAAEMMVPLAPHIETIAWRCDDPAIRLRALRLWQRIDPARTLPAGLALAADPASLAVEAERQLEGVTAREPRSPVFLRLAVLAAREARWQEAAGFIDAGAAAWDDPRLSPALSELAAELRGRADPAAACAQLETLAGEGGEPVRLTLTRALRSLGDRARWLAHVRSGAGEPAGAQTPARKATCLLEASFWSISAAASGSEPSGLTEALELAPLHPVGLGLLLASRPPPTSVADRFSVDAKATGRARSALQAALWAALGGENRRALALASGALESSERDPSALASARELARRLAWAETDAAARGTLMVKLAGMPDATAPSLVEAAESAERSGDSSLAKELFQRARASAEASLVAADVAAGLERLAPLVVSGRDARDRLSPLARGVAEGRWADVVSALVDAPPHEDVLGTTTLNLAIELCDGRVGAARAAELATRAGPPSPDGGVPSIPASPASPASPVSPALAYRVFAGHAGDPRGRAALEMAVAAATGLTDERSAALLLIEAAYAADRDSDPASVERCLRAAAARDPLSAPAATAWRRWLVRAGRLGDAADASATEADALVDPILRVQALVRAAALVMAEKEIAMRAPDTDPVAAKARAAHAAGFLRRALQIVPQDADVFAKLRDLYDEECEYGSMADLLAQRLAATSNPFEMTALYLGRADLFAGPLHDPAAAKAELSKVLAKDPQHGRALGRLADLEEADGNYAAAAELLMQRAAGERSPEKLRELFLRLGRIHTRHAPDPKRAVAAYARVLQLDANNREALDALSQLYTGLGENKNASAVTERLARLETAPENRTVYYLRLGQLAERASDLRAAAQHFRRAVDESPRDVGALGELVRFLDKVHDVVGRGQALDAAASALRAAVLAKPTDASSRDGLATVMRWRGRPAAAAAALDLGRLVGQAAPGEDGGAAMARRLTALANPQVDDLTFPAEVPSAVRLLFRALGPLDRQNQKPELARFHVDRSHRVPEGRAPREIFEAIAAELGVGPFELYLAPGDGGGATLTTLPGRPPVVVLGVALVKLGPDALRFAAARTLRLAAAYLEAAVVGTPVELAAWLLGVIRQFVPGYQRDDVPPALEASATARMAKLITKKSKPELTPFALEASGVLDVPALWSGIRDGANRVGLLAAGRLDAALQVVFALSDRAVTPQGLASNPEARALIAFALSDEYDDLVRRLE